MVSAAALLTTSNVVRQSIVPAELSLKTPASTIAPVDVPGENVAVYVTTLAAPGKVQ